MPRKNLEELSQRQPTLVYIAGNVVDADKAENLLNEEGMDYALDIDSYVNTSLLGGQYAGLFFYVPQVDHSSCLEKLEARGLTDTVMLEGLD